MSRFFRFFNFDFVRVDQLSGKIFDFFQEFSLCRERPFSFNKPI